ncbi:MAG: multicopper oxidase domain-containing protein [Anaerolineae bacterium]
MIPARRLIGTAVLAMIAVGAYLMLIFAFSTASVPFGTASALPTQSYVQAGSGAASAGGSGAFVPSVPSLINENYDYQIAVPTLARSILPPLAFGDALSSDYSNAQVRRGGERMPYVEVGDSLRTYELFARVVRWTIADDTQVTAYTFNGMVPAPVISLYQGQHARIALTNALDQSTSVQWRGLNAIATIATGTENVASSLENPIAPGEARYYEFDATTVGAFPYMATPNNGIQTSLGFAGMVVVRPRDASSNGVNVVDVPLIAHEWRVVDGVTYVPNPEPTSPDEESNFFTLNGKAYPSSDPIRVREGDVVRLHILNASYHPFTFTIDGQSFTVLNTVSAEGSATPDPSLMENFTVAPGENVDIEFTAGAAVETLLHSVDAQYTINPGSSEPGGWIVPLVISAGG